ncbi:MAG: DUF3368 domain-containing protein [Pirellulales bacterium]
MNGTLSVFRHEAKQRNLLPSIRPSLDALLRFDFRIAPALYEHVLRDAGEQ